MYFFATGHVSHPEQLEALREDEDRVLGELKAEGTVTAAFRRVGGPGILTILSAASLADVTAQMARLPFVAHGLLTFDYEEITEF
jgi:uncharacterized protein YciI